MVRQPAESLGEACTRPTPLLLGTQAHRLARPSPGLGELRAVTLDGGGLALDGVGHVDPHVGVERSRQQHGGHLVGRAGRREVKGKRRGRHHGIQQHRAGDAMVAMVEVLLAEEDRRRVVTAHHVGT